MKKMTALLILAGFGLSVVYAIFADADDVYNFYFQKGSAPQNVVQGGAGQQIPAASHTNTEPSPTPAPTPAASPTLPSAADSPVAPPAPTSYKPFGLSFGYGHLSDPVGGGMAYSLGIQYQFNRYLGIRAQGRLRNLQSGSSISGIPKSDLEKNKWGALAALTFTPLHLELLGHRFVDFSILAGVETYRRIKSSSSDLQGGTSYDITTSLNPSIGLSAMLGLNENVGIELQASRTTRSTSLGGNLVFKF